METDNIISPEQEKDIASFNRDVRMTHAFKKANQSITSLEARYRKFLVGRPFLNELIGPGADKSWASKLANKIISGAVAYVPAAAIAAKAAPLVALLPASAAAVVAPLIPAAAALMLAKKFNVPFGLVSKTVRGIDAVGYYWKRFLENDRKWLKNNFKGFHGGRFRNTSDVLAYCESVVKDTHNERFKSDPKKDYSRQAIEDTYQIKMWARDLANTMAATIQPYRDAGTGKFNGIDLLTATNMALEKMPWASKTIAKLSEVHLGDTEPSAKGTYDYKITTQIKRQFADNVGLDDRNLIDDDGAYRRIDNRLASISARFDQKVGSVVESWLNSSRYAKYVVAGLGLGAFAGTAAAADSAVAGPLLTNLIATAGSAAGITKLAWWGKDLATLIDRTEIHALSMHNRLLRLVVGVMANDVNDPLMDCSYNDLRKHVESSISFALKLAEKDHYSLVLNDSEALNEKLIVESVIHEALRDRQKGHTLDLKTLINGAVHRHLYNYDEKPKENAGLASLGERPAPSFKVRPAEAAPSTPKSSGWSLG